MTKPKPKPEPKFDHTLLKSWMHTAGVTAVSLAETCKVTDVAVHNWREGNSAPGCVPFFHLMVRSRVGIRRWMGQS